MNGAVRMMVGAFVATAGMASAGAAEAGFDICNETKDDITVAFGYREGGQWTSTGWWNIEPGNCATVYEQSLHERYYYYYAEQVNGDLVWGGETEKDLFCATDEAFTIAGDADCEARGYDSYKFRQVDVGKKLNIAIDLTD